MLQCPNFWISMKRVVSLLGSLHKVNEAVRHTRNETDAMRASHYEWRVTRLEILRKICRLKLRVYQLAIGSAADTASLSEFSADSLLQGLSSERDNSNQNNTQDKDGIPNDEEETLSAASCKEQKLSSDDLRESSNIFPSSVSQSTKKVRHPENRTVSSISNKKSKPNDDENSQNIQSDKISGSSEHKSGKGVQDELSTNVPEALIVNGSVLSHTQPFPHSVYLGDSLTSMALSIAHQLSYDSELTITFYQICALLEVDERFTEKLVTQFVCYRDSCYQLLYCLSSLQDSTFLFNLMSEIVQETFPPFSISSSIVKEYQESKLSPVEILVDVLSHLRGCIYFEPLKNLLSSSERNMRLLSTNKSALWKSMLIMNCDHTRLMIKRFLGFGEDASEDRKHTALFDEWVTYLDTRSHSVISSALRREVQRFSYTRYGCQIATFLDNLAQNIHITVSGYECIEDMLLVEPPSFYSASKDADTK